MCAGNGKALPRTGFMHRLEDLFNEKYHVVSIKRTKSAFKHFAANLRGSVETK